MQGKVLRQVSEDGGGFDINGIIEDYQVASGGNISAGDFVKFINRPTVLENGTKNYVYYKITSIESVELTDNKVCIAFTYSSGAYATICEISETNIIVGTRYQIISNSNSSYLGKIRIAKATENRIVIGALVNGTNDYLYVTLCDISGTTVTSYKSRGFSVGHTTDYDLCAITNTKVFVILAQTYLKGLTLSINSSNIFTNNTPVSVADAYTTTTLYKTKTIFKDGNSVYIIVNDSSGSIFGILCSMPGTNVNVLNIQQIINGFVASREISLTKISSNKMLITYSDINNAFYGVICTIDNSQTIVNITTLLLNSSSQYIDQISILLLDENNFFIVYKQQNSYEILCNIKETKIQLIENKMLFSDALIPFFLVANIINSILVITYFSTGDGAATIELCDIKEIPSSIIKQLETTDDEIAGIALQSGTEEETINVMIPDIEEE